MNSAVLQVNKSNILPDVKCLFPGIFASHSFDIGTFSLIHHCIDTGTSQPFYSGTGRIPIAYESRVEEMVNDLLKHGIIEPSTSPWNAPLVVVPKAGKEIRLCVDYRKLNSLSSRPIYHIPSSDEIFDSLGGNSFFSTLDLNKGYYQVPISDLDREKTAFSTPKGHFQFTKMPFGLSGAPATFQRALSSVLCNEVGKQCCVYLDDIIVFGRTIEEHNHHLINVLQKLFHAGLKLSEKKCVFLEDRVKFLGHVIDKNGIQTDPQKIHAVSNWSLPEKINELHSFISFANYYRKFIPKFNEIVLPLENLIERKGSKPLKTMIIWNKEAEDSFEKLKQALCSTPVLAFPQTKGKFILDCDASDVGIGAVLSQVQEGGEKVIAYASNKLSQSERNYCATRRELLSVVHYLRKFRHYLLGTKFVIRTDHQSLVWLLNWTSPSSKQYFAWIEELLEYDFTIQHRKGSNHVNADVMSRFQICKQCPLIHPPNSITNFVRVTQPDEGAPDKISLERSKGIELARQYHKRLGHVGGSKLYNTLKLVYYWTGMKSDIFSITGGCHICLQRKSGTNTGIPKRHILAEYPFQTVSVDITGPLPLTKNGNRYILGMIDNFSRYTILVPLKTMNSVEVAHAIEKNLFYEYGSPDCLHSDRGTYFVSSNMRSVLREWNVQQSLSSPYYPEGNSIVERLFRTVKDMIFCINRNSGLQWDEALPQITFSLRVCKHEILQLTPFEIIFGFQAKFGEMNKNRSNSHLLQTRLLQLAQKAGKQRIKLSENSKVKINDIVFACVLPKQQKSVYKPRYDGPFEVISVSGSGNQLKLKCKNNGKIIVRNRHHVKLVPNNVYDVRSKEYAPVMRSESGESHPLPSVAHQRYPSRQHTKPHRLGFS